MRGLNQSPQLNPNPTGASSSNRPRKAHPDFVQIIDSRATEASRSPTIESLRAAGVEVPDLSKLPEGSYTWKEAVEMAGKPAAAPSATEQPVFEKPPISVYHGTGGFEGELDPSKADLGIHFTTDPRVASWFAEQAVEGGSPQVHISKLSLKNPINIPDFGSFDVRSFSHYLSEKGLISKKQMSSLNRLAERDETAAQSQVRKLLQKNGYDSVKYLNRTEIFDPKLNKVVDVSDYLRERGLDNVPRNLWKMSDNDFKKLVPDAADTYIAFNKNQISSGLRGAAQGKSNAVEQWLERAIQSHPSRPHKTNGRRHRRARLDDEGAGQRRIASRARRVQGWQNAGPSHRGRRRMAALRSWQEFQRGRGPQVAFRRG